MEAANFKPVSEVEALGDYLETNDIDGKYAANFVAFFVLAYGMGQNHSGQESKRSLGEG